MPTLSRADARLAGLTYYQTGKPCVHGHTGDRYVSTGNCAECIKSRPPSTPPPRIRPRPGVVVLKNVLVPIKHVSAIQAVIQIYMRMEGLSRDPGAAGRE